MLFEVKINPKKLVQVNVINQFMIGIYLILNFKNVMDKRFVHYFPGKIDGYKIQF